MKGVGQLKGVLLETWSWLPSAQYRAQGRTPHLGKSECLWGWDWEYYMCPLPGPPAWLFPLPSNKQCIKGPISTPPWRDLYTENTTSPQAAIPNEQKSRIRKVLFKIWSWEPSIKRALLPQGDSEFDTIRGILCLQSETHRHYCRDHLMGAVWHLPYMGITWQSLASNWLGLLLWLGEWLAVMIGGMAGCYD